MPITILSDSIVFLEYIIIFNSNENPFVFAKDGNGKRGHYYSYREGMPKNQKL